MSIACANEPTAWLLKELFDEMVRDGGGDPADVHTYKSTPPPGSGHATVYDITVTGGTAAAECLTRG
jgi:hypothetical protein